MLFYEFGVGKEAPRIQRPCCFLCGDDVVKDDFGSNAVSTAQGSSASHMTAAKVWDVRSRLPDCAGEASDAVSAYTQVNMEDASDLLRLPKSECPTVWIRLPRSRCPQSWDK